SSSSPTPTTSTGMPSATRSPTTSATETATTATNDSPPPNNDSGSPPDDVSSPTKTQGPLGNAIRQNCRCAPRLRVATSLGSTNSGGQGSSSYAERKSNRG